MTDDEYRDHFQRSARGILNSIHDHRERSGSELRLIASQVVPNRGIRIVLYEGWNETTPWVTWIENEDTGGRGLGHYHTDRDEAIQDFRDRWHKWNGTDGAKLRGEL